VQKRVLKAAYICDSCGRISTITSQFARCDYCGSATHISPEDAMEIPVPKDEFGTELLAVVHQGKVVDVLLRSDRTSMSDVFSPQFVRVQEFIDNLAPNDKGTRKPTDAEVRHGNNVYLVRVADGVPHIMIPAMGLGFYAGDNYLSASERETILALALHEMCPSAEKESVVEIALARTRKSKALQATTSDGACAGVGSPPVSVSSTHEDEGFVVYTQDPQNFPDAKRHEEKQELDHASSQQEAEYLVREYQIAYGHNMRV
jgi:hypothetical protein